MWKNNHHILSLGPASMWLLLLATTSHSFTTVSSFRAGLVVLPLHSQHSKQKLPTLKASPSSPSLSTTMKGGEMDKEVTALKQVLSREYATLFNPMKTEYYSPSVSFIDPLSSLSGVRAYQDNVDMLGSRSLLGKILFQDGGIVLHTITGGAVSSGEEEIEDIVTRWTLRVTVKVLPWKPTARFTGISVYKVMFDNNNNNNNNNKRVQIVQQRDFWDSINLSSPLPNLSNTDPEQYQSVSKLVAIQDFLSQLKPNGFRAQSAAAEVPYQLLRRGKDYEVRRYPPFTGVKMPYTRRDSGFERLGSFTRGMNPLAPAIISVPKSSNDSPLEKYMTWPLTYTAPSDESTLPPPIPTDAMEKAGKDQWSGTEVVTYSKPTVVAVRGYSDASMEPVVRKADSELRDILKRDGLVSATRDVIQFAQYDATFSMGKRRGEVWIELSSDGGHPW